MFKLLGNRTITNGKFLILGLINHKPKGFEIKTWKNKMGPEKDCCVGHWFVHYVPTTK